MRHIPRLYVPEIALAAGVTVDLPDQAAHHVVVVLRRRVGEAVTLFNGVAGAWHGTIAQADKRAVAITVSHQVQQQENPRDITLFLPLLRREALEEVVLQAAVFGISVIQPVVTAHSEAASKMPKADRLARLMIDGAQQAEATFLPRIMAPQPWQAAYEIGRGTVMTWVAIERADTTQKDDRIGIIAATQQDPTGCLGIWFGPEGGWSAQEQAQWRDYRDAAPTATKLISLGPRILRAPVAATVMIAAATTGAGA